MSDQPLIKAAKLWRKTSQSGKVYLMGRLGGVRVLIFENTEAAGSDAPSHVLMLGAAPDEGSGQGPIRRQAGPSEGGGNRGQRGSSAGWRTAPPPGGNHAAPFGVDESTPF